jgi:preprotein translocase subunit SecB
MPEPCPQDPVLYAIQPTFIIVRELHFVSHRPPSGTDRIDESSVRITQKITPFNEETRRLQVSLEASFGFDDLGTSPSPPFSVKVVITAEFVVNEPFPHDKIQLWATINAPFVVYPYLRERLYYVTVQGGYPPILLPLLQIPTFKVEVPRSEPVAE